MTSRTRYRLATVAGVAVVLPVLPFGVAPGAMAQPVPSPSPATAAPEEAPSPSPDPTAVAPAGASPSPNPPDTSQDERYRFRATPHDVSLGGPGSRGKRITAFVDGYAPDPRVTIDVSGLAGVADARFTSWSSSPGPGRTAGGH